MAVYNAGCDLNGFQLLTKNLSYEGNYHRKVYYPRIVHDRTRLRLAFWSSHADSKEDSQLKLTTSSSLPDLPKALLHAEEEAELSSNLTGLLRRRLSESNENIECLEHCTIVQHIPFNLGESQDEASCISDCGSLSHASSEVSTNASSASVSVCIVII